MSGRKFLNQLTTALGKVRLLRLLVLVLVPLAVAIAADWLRDERILFPAPLPHFTTVPSPP